MRVIIAGGGTGGHIFPAISIAEEIARRDPGNEILFVGTKNGFEVDRIQREGYNLKFINSGGIVSMGFVRGFKGVLFAVRGIFDSLRILINFKPNVVIGVGGYVSGPVVIATCMLLTPSVICEQNAVPGLTNRILARFAKRVFATFQRSTRYFPNDKTVVVGNPVRAEILNVNSVYKNHRGIKILVLGGSQGAHKLNVSVPKAIGMLGRNDLFIIHQTGNMDIEDVRKTYEWYGIRAEVLPFIDDMANVYNDTALVIGRSGAGTISEITVLGKPSILIPYPFSANNHQLENAKVLERAGAAVIIEDKLAFPERIAETISDLLNNNKLDEMMIRSKNLGKPNAAKDIVDEIYRIVEVG
ncbi:MAG: undecaprenyldiphospho-muramoylpentapeptide beta-N-acetylglucosaminyltransferase [Deltaproteobacteria bacterium]|nr:undecaprenyldiphospho-muramoylpentapeptide beta-N-acetylglucosaminyltransferase [Deltaproteobacteria bacterium]